MTDGTTGVAQGERRLAIRGRRDDQKKMPIWALLSALLHGSIVFSMVWFSPLRDVVLQTAPQPPETTVAGERIEEMAEYIQMENEDELRERVREMEMIRNELARIEQISVENYQTLAETRADEAPKTAEEAAAEALRAQQEAIEAQSEAVKKQEELEALRKDKKSEEAERKASEVIEVQKKAQEAQKKAEAAMIEAARAASWVGQNEVAEAYNEAREKQVDAYEAQSSATGTQEDAEYRERRANEQVAKAQEATKKREEMDQPAKEKAQEAEKQTAEAAKAAEEAKKAEEKRKELAQEKRKAEDVARKAESAAKRAKEEAKAEAKKEAEKAVAEAKKTEEAYKAAEIAAKEAQKKAKDADTQRRKAVDEAKRAENELAKRKREEEKQTDEQVKRREEAEAKRASAVTKQQEARKAQEEALAENKRAAAELLAAVKQAQDVDLAQVQPAEAQQIDPTELAQADLTELYELARELEEDIANNYKDVRSADLAVLRNIPLAEAAKNVDVAKPVRPELPKSPSPIRTTKALEEHKAAVETAMIQSESMVALARNMLAVAMNMEGTSAGNQGVTVESLLNRSAAHAALNSAASEVEGKVADLTTLMKGGEQIPPESRYGEAKNDGGESVTVAAKAGNHPTINNNTPLVRPGRTVGMSGQSTASWMIVDGWYWIGPFPNPARMNIDKKFPPESVVDLDASYIGKNNSMLRWEYVQAPGRVAGPRNAEPYGIWYAYTEIRFDKPCDLWIAVGSDDKSKIWVNDLLIWESAPQHKSWSVNEGYRKVHFQAGRNRILYRLENGHHAMGMSFIVCMNPEQ